MEQQPKLSYYQRQKAKRLLAEKTAAAPKQTDQQIEKRLTARFEALDILTRQCIAGHSRSLIVSGPGGLGKSFTVEQIMKQWDPKQNRHAIVKGFIRATGLYQLLWKYRTAGSVLVFDDSDALFYDTETLGLLKAVCDTTEKRFPSWHAETRMVDDSGELLPRSFEFNGTIIFISNIDFDEQIAKGHKLAPHLEALISRSHYIDLAMKSRRDFIVRIRQVIGQGLLDHLTASEKKDVIEYIERNHAVLREVSLRIALKIASLRAGNHKNWQTIADVTCCRNQG